MHFLSKHNYAACCVCSRWLGVCHTPVKLYRCTSLHDGFTCSFLNVLYTILEDFLLDVCLLSKRHAESRELLSVWPHTLGAELTEAWFLERRSEDSCLSLCSPASSHLAVLQALRHQSMCQFEGRMRRLIDTLLATRRGNFLCVCACV